MRISRDQAHRTSISRRASPPPTCRWSNRALTAKIIISNDSDAPVTLTIDAQAWFTPRPQTVELPPAEESADDDGLGVLEDGGSNGEEPAIERAPLTPEMEALGDDWTVLAEESDGSLTPL